MGIHPILTVATFFDPRTKSLFYIGDEASKLAIWNRVLNLMIVSETETRGNTISEAAESAESAEAAATTLR